MIRTFQTEALATARIRWMFGVFISASCAMFIFMTAIVFAPVSCKSVPPPTSAQVQAVEDAAPAIATGTSNLCQALTAIDESGTLQSICAALPEILSAAAVIAPIIIALAERPDSGYCSQIPNTRYCATNAEKLRMIRFILRARAGDAGFDASVALVR